MFATPSALERHADLRDAAREAGIEVVFTTEGVLDAMADTVTPQGIVAVARQTPTSRARRVRGIPPPRRDLRRGARSRQSGHDHPGG
jgi:tRNA G18 (ribose-2'-O)-methylase SpoU